MISVFIVYKNYENIYLFNHNYKFIKFSTELLHYFRII